MAHLEKDAVRLVECYQFRLALLCINNHGAELIQDERLAVLPDPDLPEQSRAAVAQADCDAYGNEQRQQYDQDCERDSPVEGLLDEPPRPGELGVIQVEQ